MSAEILKKNDVIQVKNPRNQRYVKIDRTAGRILSTKKSPGPYANTPIARHRKGSV